MPHVRMLLRFSFLNRWLSRSNTTYYFIVMESANLRVMALSFFAANYFWGCCHFDFNQN